MGDVYSAPHEAMLPRSLEAAVESFERSQLGRLAFGAEVMEHYVHFFSTEADAYRRAVTDWERIRYFERI